MLIHRRRIATTRSPATPIGPEGCGGVGPSPCSPLLGDEKASPASRLRGSGPTALATIVQLFRGHYTSQLLLIRLIQQDATGSVYGCRVRRFPKRSASFNRSSLLRKPASSICLPVAGPMVSFALDAATGRPTNWSAGDGDNVQVVGTKFP